MLASRSFVAVLASLVLLAAVVFQATASGASGQTDVAVVAHRGASGHAPEHTIAAYDLAIEMGADYIEQDLQMTADHVLVVLHNPTLDDTASGPTENCTGPVITKTLEQIKTCDVGSWFNATYPEKARPEYVGLKIPTLEEVFQRYGKKVRYYIETKTPASAPGMEEELLRLIDEYGLREGAVTRWQVLIQSFQPESLTKIHALDPALPLIQLGVAGDAQTLNVVSEYAVGIGPSFGGVDQELVDNAHALCLEVHPYTVNDLDDMERLIGFGVDGMFTNFPDVLSELRGSIKWSSKRIANEKRTCEDAMPADSKTIDDLHLVGAMHEHSAYSDGYPGSRPLDYFLSGKGYGLDFMGSSDHSDNLGIPLVFNEECLTPGITGCAVADDDNPVDSFRKWDATLEQSAEATDDSYTAFRGFEWSSDRFGHINVFFSDNFVTDKTDGGAAATLETFWRWFLTSPDQLGGADGIATFNHPDGKKLSDTDIAKNWNDFAYVASADYRMVGIEVYNRTRNYDPWYVRALDKGWHVGAMGAEDLGHDRSDSWGAPEYAKTVILAPDASAESLEAALLARSYYAILDKDVRIEFDAGGSKMGSRLARVPGEDILLTANVTGAATVELVTNGGEVLASTNEPELKYEVKAAEAERYYFIRVLDETGKYTGYSSPIWITGDTLLD